jgi:GT2 family glycosyltransferase
MISIVIVNWNQAKLLHDCVESILDNPPTEGVEVIVVDNASEDNSVELMQSMFPQVKLICNERNLGFGVANNIGIRVSTGWSILLLNNDTIVMPGAIDAMADALRLDDLIGIVGCSQFADRELTHKHRTAYRRFPSIAGSFAHQLALYFKLPQRFPENKYVDNLLMNYSLTDHENILESAHINGACMLCRRSALDEVGLFDENLFLFLEDTDLCQRMGKSGRKIVFTPAGSVVHFGSQSLVASGIGFKEFHYKSKRYYLKKHYGVLALAIYDLEFAIIRRIKPSLLNQEYGV